MHLIRNILALAILIAFVAAPGRAQAQRAVLADEDPSNPKGVQHTGTVAWRTNPVKSPGRPDDVEIVGDVQIPSRKLVMTIALRRNRDETLPASHVIEVKFRLPADFAGGGVSELPGVTLKTSEEAKGTALSGLSVKVTDNFFMLGLSNLAADRARNVLVLTRRAWFDVPIVYANKKRGILAIEKGPSGEQAFKAAFAAWGDTAGAEGR